MNEQIFNENNNIHIDILREIGNIGSGNATTALANLLNKKIDMGVPKVNILGFKELAEIIGGEETLVVSVLIRLTGDIQGMMMFILNEESSHQLVRILLSEQKRVDKDFTEIELSAIKEIGNILCGAYISSLSTLTNLFIQSSIPYLAIDMAGAILSVPAIEFGKIGDQALLIQTDFGEKDDNVSGYFILIPEMTSFDIILKSLGVIGE